MCDKGRGDCEMRRYRELWGHVRSGGGFRGVGDRDSDGKDVRDTKEGIELDGIEGSDFVVKKRFVLLDVLSAFLFGLMMVFMFGVGDVYAIQKAPEDAKMDFDYKSDYQLTAYAPSAGGINCDGECKFGSMGTEVMPMRTIAVDPSIIPYGSIVMIKFDNGKTKRDDLKKYNGIYLAEDTGGAIKNKRIDVLIEPEDLARAFGRVDNVSVAIVEPGKSNRKEASALAKERALNWSKYVEKYKDLKVGSVKVGDNEDLKDDIREQAKRESPFIYGDVQVGNVGLDDRKGTFSNVNEYGAFVLGGKIGQLLFNIAQLMAILLIGVISFYWLLGVMAFGGMYFANEWLHKLTFGKVDMYDGGFGVLFKYTMFAFVVAVIVVSGMIPTVFSWIYQMLSDFIAYLDRFTFL